MGSRIANDCAGEGYVKHAREDSNLQPLVPKTSADELQGNEPQGVTSIENDGCTIGCTRPLDEVNKSVGELADLGTPDYLAGLAERQICRLLDGEHFPQSSGQINAVTIGDRVYGSKLARGGRSFVRLPSSTVAIRTTASETILFVTGFSQIPRSHSLPQTGEYPDFPEVRL
jgi:hypothetical protein